LNLTALSQALRSLQIDLSVRPILPQTALADLEARQANLVIQPLAKVPPRFQAARLYEEEFAIAMRSGCNWTCVAWQMIGSVKGKCLRKRGTNCLADVSSNQCGRLGRERIDCTGETSGGDFDHFDGYVEDCTPG
jgi:hypothetical protein